MSASAHDTTRINLCGNWSINGVAAQLPFLNSSMSSFTTGAPRQQAEICTQGIESIDASGCQLLAVFFHSIRRNGHEPKLLNPSPTLRGSLETLGFTPVFDSEGA